MLVVSYGCVKHQGQKFSDGISGGIAVSLCAAKGCATLVGGKQPALGLGRGVWRIRKGHAAEKMAMLRRLTLRCKANARRLGDWFYDKVIECD